MCTTNIDNLLNDEVYLPNSDNLDTKLTFLAGYHITETDGRRWHHSGVQEQQSKTDKLVI